MKNQILLLLLLPILCFTCKSDDSPTYDSEFGSIYVTARSNGLLSDVLIITNPETIFFQTDMSGSVIVKDIEPNTYEIFASHPDYGTGTGTVTVKQGEITELEIDLTSSGVFEYPVVNFVSPSNGDELDNDTPIEFTVFVSDNNDNSQDIDLEWSSNLDGLLSTQSAGFNEVSTIAIDDLSIGDHSIQVKAIDTEGYIGGAVVNITVSDIPNTVYLNPIQGLSTGIQLQWTEFDESNFSSYKIYRSKNSTSDFQEVEKINDINTLTFFDNDVSLGNNYYYQIGVNLSNGEERISNTQFIPYEGTSIYVGTEIEKMIVDPTRNYLYALDRDNNSLLFINTNQNILTKTIFVGSSPTDLDISIDGTKLFIANFGSTQINVVDLDTREIDYSFFVDPSGIWDGNPYRIAALSNNRLAYTGEDQWNDIKIVDAVSGTEIDASGTLYEPNLFTNSEGSILYAAESSYSGSQVFRYDITGNTLQQVDQSDGGSTTRSGFITANGAFIFSRKRKLLASNLQSILGTFPDEIYAANKNGSIALGDEEYFDGTNFISLGDLPVESKIMAADPNDNIFYIYNEINKSIVVFTP